jgi:uncharacterized protein YneF (UPF0154 family)
MNWNWLIVIGIAVALIAGILHLELMAWLAIAIWIVITIIELLIVIGTHFYMAHHKPHKQLKER